MTIIIKGNLILEKDTEYNESLVVEGNIFGKDGMRYYLKVNGNLTCWDLTCRNLTCEDLTCWNLTCRNLTCGNLTCWDLTCEDLTCWNLTCWDLTCGDLNCWDLNCRDLDCQGNISYYAVCFAYNNLKCKSIKGRRENCKHFVLDGKIIIEKLSKEIEEEKENLKKLKRRKIGGKKDEMYKFY